MKDNTIYKIKANERQYDFDRIKYSPIGKVFLLMD